MTLARAVAPVAFLAAVTAVVVALHGRSAHRPTAPAPAPAAVVHRVQPRHAPRSTVRVGPGDTLGAIALRLHTTVSRLERLNPGLDPTALRVGQTIRVK